MGKGENKNMPWVIIDKPNNKISEIQKFGTGKSLFNDEEYDNWYMYSSENTNFEFVFGHFAISCILDGKIRVLKNMWNLIPKDIGIEKFEEDLNNSFEWQDQEVYDYLNELKYIRKQLNSNESVKSKLSTHIRGINKNDVENLLEIKKELEKFIFENEEIIVIPIKAKVKSTNAINLEEDDFLEEIQQHFKYEDKIWTFWENKKLPANWKYLGNKSLIGTRSIKFGERLVLVFIKTKYATNKTESIFNIGGDMITNNGTNYGNVGNGNSATNTGNGNNTNTANKNVIWKCFKKAIKWICGLFC
jgi:hypothetical protein